MPVLVSYIYSPLLTVELELELGLIDVVDFKLVSRLSGFNIRI